MKILLFIMILTFNFQSLIKADDIRDFKLEGFSIGDSLIDYYDELEVKNSKPLNYPNSDKFYQIAFIMNDAKYEAISFNLKKDDKKYIIHQIKGLISYDNKIDECLKEKNKIVKSISSDLEIMKEDNYESYFNNTVGKSVAYVTDLLIENGGFGIWCTKWDKEHEKVKSTGWWDSLNVDIFTTEFKDFLAREAY